VENFIEKYLPIRVLSQISEIFQTMFPDSLDGTGVEAKRLKQYERTKYKQYN